MLRPNDDSVHSRPALASDSWQENCFLLARDAAADVCIYLHVERFVDRVEVKGALDVRGNTTWHDAEDDWWYEVDAPYEKSRWSWCGGPLSIDLALSSVLPAVDHSSALEQLGLPGAERDHYESVGTFAGQVAVDGHSVSVAGEFVRDHTWGTREYHRFGRSWWWPTCFDGGTAYAGGVAVELEGRVLGYGLVASPDGVRAATDVSVAVSGAAGPRGYDGTTIRFTPPDHPPVELASRTVRHLTTTFPGFGPDRQWNEAYSTCTWGSRFGFGTRELGA